MKTTFATFTLYLLVCVAGSHAAEVDRRLKQDQASPSSSPNEADAIKNNQLAVNNAARIAVSKVSEALNRAVAAAHKNEDLGEVSETVGKDTARAFSKLIENIVDPVDEREDNVCTRTTISGFLFADLFANSFREACEESKSPYTRTTGKRLSKAVENASAEVLVNVMYSGCSFERRVFLFRSLIREGYATAIANVIQPVLFALQNKHEIVNVAC